MYFRFPGLRVGTKIQATALLVCTRKRTFGSIEPVDSYSGICLSFLIFHPLSLSFFTFIFLSMLFSKCPQNALEKKEIVCMTRCVVYFLFSVTDTFQFLTCLIFLSTFCVYLFPLFLPFFPYYIHIPDHFFIHTTHILSFCVRSSFQCAHLGLCEIFHILAR